MNLTLGQSVKLKMSNVKCVIYVTKYPVQNTMILDTISRVQAEFVIYDTIRNSNFINSISMLPNILSKYRNLKYRMLELKMNLTLGHNVKPRGCRISNVKYNTVI